MFDFLYSEKLANFIIKSLTISSLIFYPIFLLFLWYSSFARASKYASDFSDFLEIIFATIGVVIMFFVTILILSAVYKFINKN